MNAVRESNAGAVGESAWPVMVLAHNEASRIVACLNSIFEADPGHNFRIFVMANGCTDGTEDVVREYGRTHEGVNVVSIKIADYCNAWNVFIHETVPMHVPNSDVYFFMDGDCRVCPRSFSEMAKALVENPDANAVGSLPMTGRSREKDTRDMLERRVFVANLYGLRGKMVRDLQEKGVRLPLGLEGDDGLIGALVKWDLDPRREWDHRRIVPCSNAGFTFDSVSWSKLRDWRSYWRRKVRYARREYEFELLGPRLKEKGIDAIPVRMAELYRYAHVCKLHWSGVDTFFNWLALRQMRKSAI